MVKPHTTVASQRLKRAAMVTRVLRRATTALRKLPADKPVKLDEEQVEELDSFVTLICEGLDIDHERFYTRKLTDEQQRLWDAAAVPNEEGYCSEEQCRLSNQWHAEDVVASLRYLVSEAGELL